MGEVDPCREAELLGLDLNDLDVGRAVKFDVVADERGVVGAGLESFQLPSNIALYSMIKNCFVYTINTRLPAIPDP